MKRLLIVATLLAGCGGPPGWKAVPAESRAEAVATARAAAADLGGRLVKKLAAAVGEGGPASAIVVCRDEAPAVAAAVSKERGLRIGRTSHLLRNAANAPPEWAEDLAADAPRVYAHPDGRIGVTLPILAKEMCVTCHGDAGRIPDDVRTAITKAYPDDAARGFAPGDLRGQFWVEIPAKR